MEEKSAVRVLEVAATIPIQNLYYLFLYAWNRLEEGQAVGVAGVDSPELVDLFGKVLAGRAEASDTKGRKSGLCSRSRRLVAIKRASQLRRQYGAHHATRSAIEL